MCRCLSECLLQKEAMICCCDLSCIQISKWQSSQFAVVDCGRQPEHIPRILRMRKSLDDTLECITTLSLKKCADTIYRWTSAAKESCAHCCKKNKMTSNCSRCRAMCLMMNALCVLKNQTETNDNDTSYG